VLVAPMHGAVTAVEVAVGDHVEVGDRIVAVEAMKMEHLLLADVAGTVTALAAVGAQVATDAVLARIEPEDGPGGGAAADGSDAPANGSDAPADGSDGGG